ncbi:PREDICTED: uncharacterized protein LOC106126332 [Papilio xuthus]|uniref:Uncharacterized protein LOC106126332 n=1 Tax=Papilio xuthus TaxID=66420 RepID=A0A194PRV5_PAPXU|nr:PREDICTED: uncharacterized protein LOC106126332 [Papilio xuthus]XP_013179395.1 PREDICTED: uncharacterized protein LOC106126332 [Papilio xuthus]XP_013179396.1 PREDICTED: uncharacterized protein LOC106126332 [Papilio xuthus]KPI96042.1 hypothetical protein RR46_06776 [Papilio xuthus]
MQFMEEFIEFVGVVSSNLRSHVLHLCNEAFPLLSEMAAEFERIFVGPKLRLRSSLAAAVYRRAGHIDVTIRNLPKTCYWQILWANTSILSFSDITSEYSTTKKELLNFWHMHTLPTSGLRITHKDLFSLWNLAVTILDDRRCQAKLIDILVVTDVQIKAFGEAWPRYMEPDRVAFNYYVIGCCYAAMELNESAIEYLLKVTRMKPQIKGDPFLVPFAMIEAAMCYHCLGNADMGNELMNIAQAEYGSSSRECKKLLRVYRRVLRFPPGSVYRNENNTHSDLEDNIPELGLDFTDNSED